VRFGKKPSRWVLLGLSLVSVGMMFSPAGYIDDFRQLVLWVLCPFHGAGSRVTLHLRTRFDQITGTTRDSQDERLRALEHQILLMRQLIDYQRRQIGTLTKWSKNLTGFPCRLLPARVLANQASPFYNRRSLIHSSRKVLTGDMVTTRTVVLEPNSPAKDEIFVLGRNYLVGRIVHSQAHMATLQLVNDPHFRMPALLWRMVKPGQKRTIYVPLSKGGLAKRTFSHSGKTRAPEPIGQPCPVEARGDGKQIVLKHVPASHEIRPGDVLTSDSTAGLLPIGLAIGQVCKVEREKQDAHFVTVFVKPLADLSRLQDVYIIVPPTRVMD